MAELVYVGLGLQNSFLCISIDNFQLHIFILYSLKKTTVIVYSTPRRYRPKKNSFQSL